MTEAPAPDWVRRETRGRVTVLTLDHPPVNVLSRHVLEAMLARIDEVAQDPEVRAVVIASAAEKAFAAGADIREMQSLGPAEARVHAARGQSVTVGLEQLPLPVIAAVHGACFGGGCELALACDFILASEDARFGQPEINLGVMPGWGGTRRLPRRIGATRARHWILTGEAVDATRARAEGLVDRVVPRAELLPTAMALAEELSGKPPVALAAAKFALAHAADPGIAEGLGYELDLWARLFGTQGQREAMQAFLAKQPLPRLDRARWTEESEGFPWASGGGARGGRKGDKRARPKSP